MKALGTLINEVTAGIAGKQVADDMGMSPSYVCQIRSGESIPTDQMLARIACRYAPERLAELLIAAARGRAARKPPEDAEAARLLEETFEGLAEATLHASEPANKEVGRSLRDFPHAFYPLKAITGDKREERPELMTVGDLGAETATPADTRWILNLGLRADVPIHVDKCIFMYRQDDLVERLGKHNLLVIGGPATNHVTRILNRSAVFRFNHPRETELAIEEAIQEGQDLQLDRAALRQHLHSSRQRLSAKLKAFYEGGVVDPLHDDCIVWGDTDPGGQTEVVLGVLTFAANPWYAELCRQEGRENDHKYVAILAGGVHHSATAHALRYLGRDMRRRGVYVDHPFGGVIRVVLDHTLPFSELVEKAECSWQDGDAPGHAEGDDPKAALLARLEKVALRLDRGELMELQMTAAEAEQCRALLERL